MAVFQVMGKIDKVPVDIQYLQVSVILIYGNSSNFIVNFDKI